MRRKTRGRLLAMVLCVVLALSSTGMAVFASAAGEEQIEIGEPEPAGEVSASPEEDPDFFEEGEEPVVSDEEYGTIDDSEEPSGSGTIDDSEEPSASGVVDNSDDASGSGTIDISDDVPGSGTIDISEEPSGSETSDYSDAAGQEQPIPFEQSYQIGDTLITLTAESGVFPEEEAPVLETLQDDTLLQQAEEAAAPGGADGSKDSRIIFSHAMYSLTGTSMNGMVHVTMENCGLAGLRAEYPDAELVESRVYKRAAETGEIIDTVALIDTDADRVEFDLSEFCVFDLVTVIVLPAEETEEGTETPEGEGDIDGLDPALTDGEGGLDDLDVNEEKLTDEDADSIELALTDGEDDTIGNPDAEKATDPSDNTDGADIPETVEPTDGSEISDVVEVTDIPDTAGDPATPAVGDEKNSSENQNPADKAGEADTKAEADTAKTKEADAARSADPSDKRVPGSSQEIVESEEEESDAEERRNDNIARGEWGQCVCEASKDENTNEVTLTIRPGEDGNEGASQEGKDKSPWFWDKDNIKKIVFEEKDNQKVKLPEVSSYLFYNLEKLESMDFSGCDTSSVKDMYSMFCNCKSLTKLDVSDWNTSSVTDMSNLFDNCKKLTTLDVSDWNTSSVTDMSNMFGSCDNLTTLDVSDWNTSSVTDMSGVFHDCVSLTALDVSKWKTGSVKTMYCMFYNCTLLSTLDLSGWDTSKVETNSYMFRDCSSLTSLDLSGWNTSSESTSKGMFLNCNKLARITVGGDYLIHSDDMFPNATAQGDHSDKWYSCTDSEWYAKSDVVNNRSGKADTYINNTDMICLKVTKDVSVSGTNPDINDKEFEFTVTQKGGNNNLYYDTSGKAVSPGNDEEIPAKGIHKVKNGKSVSFIDLEPGEYTVTELGTEKGGEAQIPGYVLTAEGSGSVTVSDVIYPAVTTLSNKYVKILTVNAEGCSITYDGKPHNITVDTGSSGATVYYAAKELTADNFETDGRTENPAYTTAGTCDVYFYVDASGYAPDPQTGKRTVTIKPADIAITADDKESGCSQPIKELTWKVTGGYVEGDDLGISATTDATASSGAGDYPITLRWNNNGNYKAKLNAGNYRIAKVPPTVTAPKAKTGLTYSGKAQTLITAGSTSDGTLQYSLKKDGTFTSTLPAATDAGTYTAYYKVKGDKNHKDSAVMGPVNVTIGKAAAACTAPKAKTGLVYSGKAQTLITAGSTSDGTLQYSLKKDGAFGTTLPAGTNAGTYTAYYKVKGDKNHKDSAVLGPVSVSVTKAQITITAQNKSGARGASIKKLTYKVSGAYASGDKLGIKLSTTAKKNSKAGKYPISVSWNKNKNYKAALKNGTYTITDRMTAAERSRARIRLNAGFKAGWNGQALQVGWGNAEDADLYEIRAAYCGIKNEMKTVRTIKGNSVSSFKITKIDGKKIDLANNIKVRVYAYRKVNGKLTLLSSTLVAHVTGGRGRTAAFTNAKKVTVTKSSYTLTTGKTAKIRAKAVLNNPAKEQLSYRHCPEFRYISDNRQVATVEEDGTITAAGRGTCTIYVFARNGIHTKVTVTVK